MTELELHEHEHEAIESRDNDMACDRRPLDARVLALVAEVRRLRELLAQAEWQGALDDEPYRACPWCRIEREFHPSNQKPHHADCPAFTPDGAVR